MSKVKQISPNNTINKISRKTVIKVEKFAKAEYEKCFNWIPAGSQKKYRDNCNKIRYELKCENDPESKKSIYQHCNKLDCENCFITTCSLKARRINERLREFRRICYANGISVGKIVHFSIIFHVRKDIFNTFYNYSQFKKKTIYPMLKDIGIIGGVMFLHLWSNMCRNCGEKEYYCRCSEEERILEKKINIHVHVLGFGYLMNVIEFRNKYGNYTYRNHLPRRSNAYYTIFYIFSKIALWKDSTGLKNSYNFFGYLHPSKFKITTRSQKSITDNCPTCKTPRYIHKIENKKLEHRVYWKTKVQKKKYRILKADILKNLVSGNYGEEGKRTLNY